MARSKFILTLALLALGAAQAQAWDLGVDYGMEKTILGEYYLGSGGSAATSSTPAFDLNMPLLRYSLVDYSGELAAGISNLNNSMAARAGAQMDAENDARRQLENGAVIATGHGERSWELAQPVEGRTVLSVATGSTTDGTFSSASGTGAIESAKALVFDYQREVTAGEWESLYGLNYAVSADLAFRSYDITYVPLTSSPGTKKTSNRFMTGLPVGLTLAHGLGLEGLQAEVYADFDVLAGLTYFAKWNGLAYGYGTRVSYKTLGFLSVFGGYDIRAYTKSSVDKNDDGSARIEGPQGMGAWRVGAAIDLSYIFDKYFTKVE